MEEKQKAASHRICLWNRQGGSISGVKDVTSFDEKEILIFTEFGKMILKGDKLHVSRLELSEGEIEITGRVDSLQYIQKNTTASDSVLKRLFQ